jgi:hypothetical protein
LGHIVDCGVELPLLGLVFVVQAVAFTKGRIALPGDGKFELLKLHVPKRRILIVLHHASQAPDLVLAPHVESRASACLQRFCWWLR